MTVYMLYAMHTGLYAHAEYKKEGGDQDKWGYQWWGWKRVSGEQCSGCDNCQSILYTCIAMQSEIHCPV